MDKLVSRLQRCPNTYLLYLLFVGFSIWKARIGERCVLKYNVLCYMQSTRQGGQELCKSSLSKGIPKGSIPLLCTTSMQKECNIRVLGRSERQILHRSLEDSETLVMG